MSDSDEYICLRIPATSAEQESLLGELLEIEFVGFEQKTDAIYAYMLVSSWTVDVQTKFSEVLFRVSPDNKWTSSLVEQANWNQVWEDSIKPVQAGVFYIHQSWRDTTGMDPGLIPIIIDPRMSFGTGHHESTRLSLVHLSDQKTKLERVLDIGTGTGILAIAAIRLGASLVIAIDHDAWSMVNAEQNIRLNGVSDRIELRMGSIDALHSDTFTLILANINRRTLERMIPTFRRIIHPKGRLILAGLLCSEAAQMRSSLAAVDFRVVTQRTEGDWWSIGAEPVT